MALMDASMAVQNILLAAHDKGLGSCVIASFHVSAVQKLLQLPSSIKPLLLIILGYPTGKPSAPKRKIEEVTWWEVYSCLLYTSDAADDLLCVDLGGRRIIK